ncbi:hypothetical protein C5B85_18240 [Pseudoclavibacter sp. AY1F1]|uniref:ABC transporter ATP-binding protein/permease n=1 Tax=Pseudoclavibacter sp. AY1F1 TaxID=2080583 RepID=UPI000CE8D0C6|nr:ABC transporter ATP-binding protein/permease [Pseudoclavibacter sp. AY1F1]PPF41861.1 hypothetical protein C5B85_18240 [Pseudoclavibacter sp. AY1F1]
MSGPLLSLVDVSRSFPTGTTLALDEVSLDISEGEFVAIVGQSGAGKSTLLNVLGLLDSPTSGQYLINGENPKALSDSERDRLRAVTFGFVFQDSFILPQESVARNVALPLRMEGVERLNQISMVELALDEFVLLEKANQSAGTLSGGERQRVAFARAIVGKPLVLLADEPTGNLDSANSRRVMDHLGRLHRHGVTVIVITHSDEVAAAAERQIRVSDGRIVADSLSVSSSSNSRRSSQKRTFSIAPQEDSAWRGTGKGRTWHAAEALTALLLSPIRSMTILLAFIVAVAGLVSAVNLTATAASQVSSKLSAAALDQVVVHFESPEELQLGADRVRSLEGVVAVASDLQIEPSDADLGRNVGSQSFDLPSRVRVVDPAFLALNEIVVGPSNAPGLFAAEDGSPTALLGPDVAAELGLDTSRVGEIIRVNEQDVVVVGYIESSIRDVTLARGVLLSQADFILPESGTWQLLVRTEPGLPAKIAEALPLTIDPVHPEDVRIETVADLRELTAGVNGDLAVNVFVISSVLLLLVCLTSSISMFLTVLARTREIALRRAVGASKADVRTLFLMEGAILGLAGGVAGCSVGIVATSAVCLALGWAPTFDPAGALAAVAASLFAGSVSAIVPARRAAGIEAALALRAN